MINPFGNIFLTCSLISLPLIVVTLGLVDLGLRVLVTLGVGVFEGAKVGLGSHGIQGFFKVTGIRVLLGAGFLLAVGTEDGTEVGFEVALEPGLPLITFITK